MVTGQSLTEKFRPQGPAPARGFRNLPKGDLPALARAIVAFSRLAALETVSEAEINPLIIMPEGQGVVMADALLTQAPTDPHP